MLQENIKIVSIERMSSVILSANRRPVFYLQILQCLHLYKYVPASEHILGRGCNARN